MVYIVRAEVDGGGRRGEKERDLFIYLFFIIYKENTDKIQFDI